MIFQTYTLPVVVPTTLPLLLTQAPPDRPQRVILQTLTAGAAVLFSTDFNGLQASVQEGYQMQGISSFADVVMLAPREKLYVMSVRGVGVAMQLCVHASEGAAFDVLDDGGGVL